MIEQVGRWAMARPDVLAVALAGSWARDSAGPGSDVDLVVLTADPEAYLGDGWAAVPPDAGTARVVSGWFVVLHDPSGLLERLVRAVAQGS